MNLQAVKRAGKRAQPKARIRVCTQLHQERQGFKGVELAFSSHGCAKAGLNSNNLELKLDPVNLAGRWGFFVV